MAEPKTRSLTNVNIAILATDGFEPSELQVPLDGLRGADATVHVVAPKAGQIRAWKKEWGDAVDVDVTLDDADPAEYDAVVLPGGVINPDQLRTDERALDFVRAIAKAGKPVAAICHGPWTLISAGVVRGKRMTSWPSLVADLTNAGADWVDEPVVVDGNFVTSRNPDDLPVFLRETIALCEQHAKQQAGSG